MAGRSATLSCFERLDEPVPWHVERWPPRPHDGYNQRGASHACSLTVTNDLSNPGVGDYTIGNNHLNVICGKSPKATIGNEPRFKKAKLKEYIPNVPHQYVGNAS